MFEARFQTFEDRRTRRRAGPRIAALRAELARRGLTGFIVPRADRYQNEYVPACEERLAWLTGFTGSAGVAIVLLDRAVDLRRRPLHAAGARADRSGDLHDRAPGRHAGPTWLEDNLPAGTQLGYDPWLHTVEAAEKLAKACERRRRDAGADRAQSDRCDLDRPAAPPLGPVVLHDIRYAGDAGGGRSSRISAARSASSRPTRSSSPIRTRSPGPSTSAAPTSRIRRCRSPSRSCRSEGRPALYVDGRKLDNTVRHALEELADVREPAEFAARPRGARQGAAHRAARPGDRRRRAGPHRQRGGRQDLRAGAIRSHA